MKIRTITSENPALQLTHDDRLSPLGKGQLAIIGAVASFVGLISLGYIVWRYWQDSADYLSLIPASLIVLCSGGLALAMHQYYRRRLDYRISFDPQTGLVTYDQKGHTGTWSRPIHEVRKLLLTSESSEESNTRYYLYLIWQDGTHWWLLDSDDENTIRAEVEEMNDLLDLPVDDKSDLGLGMYTEGQHKIGQAIYDLKPSKYLMEARLHGTLGLRLLRPYTLKNQLIGFLLLFWILGIPAWALYQSGLKGLVSPTTYWVLAALLLMVGLIVSIFIVYQKRYTLLLRPGGLQIELGLGPGWLDKFIGEKLFIPEANIKGVHVHRLPGGRFWLSLKLDKEVKLPAFGKMMFNQGVFRRPTQDWEEEGFEIGLWEVPADHTSKQGPYLGDVLALKKLIERQYLKDLHDICT